MNIEFETPCDRLDSNLIVADQIHTRAVGTSSSPGLRLFGCIHPTPGVLRFVLKGVPVEKESTQITLVDIDREYRAIVAQIEAAGGELTPESEAELERIMALLCQKADGYGIVMHRLESEANFWKMQKDRCAKAQKIFENESDRLKERMKYVLKDHPEKSIQGALFRFTLVKGQDTLSLKEDILPNEFKVAQMSLVPDKQKILALLKEGAEIPGAALKTDNYALKPGRPKQ